MAESSAGRRVWFVGLGNMGIPMTRRLVGAGYHVRGFDLSPDAMGNFAALGSAGPGGVTAVAGLESVGDGASAVILMLPDSNIVERVLLGRLADEPEPADEGSARAAEEIAMLDLLSGGRVDSGFVRGIGWEYFGHSINPTKSRSRFNEAHDLILKAWTSPEMFS